MQDIEISSVEKNEYFSVLDELNIADEYIKKKREMRFERKDSSNVEIVKNKYSEHPAIMRMTRDAVVLERSKRKIYIDATSDVEIPNPVLTFEQASFPESITRLLLKHFILPTPMQSQFWPIALSGYDVLGVSQTGTGKTLAFLLPCIYHVLVQNRISSRNLPLALILVPTRELAVQITQCAKLYTQSVSLQTETFPSRLGAYIKRKSSRENPLDIVIGTVTSVYFLSNDKFIDLSHVSFLVLDEVNSFLCPFFSNHVKCLIGSVHPDCQIVMMSSAFKPFLRSSKKSCTVTNITKLIGRHPLVVSIGRPLCPVDTVSQSFYLVQSEEEKLDICCGLLSNYCHKQTLVFKNSFQGIHDLKNAIEKQARNIFPCVIHSDLTSIERRCTFEKFRQRQYNCLICTNLISMGIDVMGVFQVLNYDCPKTYKDYVLRVGRTARAGRKGIVMTLISKEDVEGCPNFFRNIFSALQNEYIPEWLGDLLRLANEKMKKKLQNRSRLSESNGNFTYHHLNSPLRNQEDSLYRKKTLRTKHRHRKGKNVSHISGN